MEEHLLKEERFVFPLIEKYEENPSGALLQEIRNVDGKFEDEYYLCGEFLKEIRVITNGFELSECANNSYRITYDCLKELVEETFQHVHLESNILYKRL